MVWKTWRASIMLNLIEWWRELEEPSIYEAKLNDEENLKNLSLFDIVI